jgi:site-specific recombinase XerD
MPAPSLTDRLSLPEALTGFTLYLRAKGRSPKTVSSYTEAIRALDVWRTQLGRDDEIATLTKDEFRAFIVSITDRGLKPSTARARYASLRQFYKWLHEDGYIDTDPTAGVSPPKLPKHPVPVLTDDELHRLLADAEHATTFASRRDAAILRLFVSTGARLSEVAGLTVEDVDLERGRVFFATTKGDKPREVGIGDKTARGVFRYAQERKRHRNASSSEWLWLGSRGPFTSQGIALMITRRARSAGIDKHVHAHMLRHSYASRHLTAGGEEGDLMRTMGWSDRSMLDRYGAATAQERAIAAQKRLRLDDRL